MADRKLISKGIDKLFSLKETTAVLSGFMPGFIDLNHRVLNTPPLQDGQDPLSTIILFSLIFGMAAAGVGVTLHYFFNRHYIEHTSGSRN